ncbi:Hsp20 family protein [Brevundimonas sp.]|uniref:Hsp20 family protein n=1 Tax=Brevundimonas sp. TaxID=1871086 RepID=UPI003561A59B
MAPERVALDAGARLSASALGDADRRLLQTGRGRTRTAGDDAGAERTYLHLGLAERDFERRFQLIEYMVVKTADLSNGLPSIELVRELPEAPKPRRIDIGGGSKLIESKTGKAHSASSSRKAISQSWPQAAARR